MSQAKKKAGPSKKRSITDISDEFSSPKKTCLLPGCVKPQDVIVLPNGKRVTIFCDWSTRRPVMVAAKFVNEIKMNEGRFILLQDDRTEVLDDESEAIHWTIEARKHRQKRAASKKPTDEEEERSAQLEHADIIIIPSDDKVTVYSDWMKQRPNIAAPLFIAQVQNEGGKFVLLKDGQMEFLNKEKEMMRWVMEARQKSDSPHQEPESDIAALVMTKAALKDSKPDSVAGRYVEKIGGTAFKPEIFEAQIRAFIQRASKLKNKSDVAIYQSINVLDDEEDAVHLYRNFHDEAKIVLTCDNNIIGFSRREVDILAYATLYGIDWDFTWNLMPYRNRKEFYKLYYNNADGSMQEKLNIMLKDRTYVQHLNQCVSQLFEEL
mmetsp:Transcript_14171/g.20938  ORF Transcript_14171/g.20938 Transcript_14171/m.20938 type:complete len:378 (+) Transcript_14171:159-1292(+)